MKKKQYLIYLIMSGSKLRNIQKDQNSDRMKDALYNLPKTKAKILNPPLPAIENIEDSYEEISDNDKVTEMKKLSYHQYIIDIYTRLEILLGLKLSGHTNTLTEANNPINELYKK